MSTTNTTFPRWQVLLNDLNGEFNSKASTSLSIGDLVYWDSSNHCLQPFSNLSDLGSAALMQTAVAQLFMGISNGQRLSTDATAQPHRTIVDDIVEMACDSATFAVGDYVGASYNTNVLRDQQVAKVTSRHLAIGRVVKEYTSATTTVKFRLCSRYLLGMNDEFNSLGAVQTTAVATPADGNVTLTVDSATIQKQTPTVARTWTLPAVAQSKNLVFYIINQAAPGSAGILTVQNAGATTIATVYPGQTGEFICDGANWYASVATTNPHAIAPPAGGSASAFVPLGTTTAFGIYFGSGAPSVSAAQGSLYLRTDGNSTSTRAYINTNGTTGWTSITTAA